MAYNKYGNKKTIFNGIKFDSIVEKDYYIYLKSLEDQGKISNLQTQKKFILQEAYKYKGQTIRAITYIADFYYHDIDNIPQAIDVKGAILTQEFKLKLKIYRKLYPHIPITLIAKRNNKWIDYENYLKNKTKKEK